MIGYSVLMFDESFSRPGLVCVGSDSWNSFRTPVRISQHRGRNLLLGNRVLVGLGLISYSTYLCTIRFLSLRATRAWLPQVR